MVSRFIDAMLENEERSRTVLAVVGAIAGVVAVLVCLAAGALL